MECHLNKKLTKLDFLYLKENIKACKLYWSIRSRYKIKEDDIHKIINKYYGASEASRITEISNSLILRVCNHKGKTAGGYKWEFEK